MTPRGRLDERCFTDWLKGCMLLAGLALVLLTFGAVLGILYALV